MAGALKVASETGADAALDDAEGLAVALLAGGFAEAESAADDSSSHTVESGEATRFPAAGNCCADADADRPAVSVLCGGRLVAKSTTVSAATSTQRASSG